MGVPVPFQCASYASLDSPMLGFRIDLDRGLLARLVARGSPVRVPSGRPGAWSR
jgi:hypothetical protein